MSAPEDDDRKPAADTKPAVSIARKQTNRRRVLRTILLTGGVLGAAMSGFLPLVYSQKKRLRPPGALDEKTSSPVVSNAASAFRSARYRQSSWPTSSTAWVSAPR